MDNVMKMLQQISDRLARVEAQVSNGGGGGGGDDDEGPSPRVVAFDALISEKVAPFQAACKDAGVPKMADIASAAYGALRTFIDMASKCYKPAEMAELQKLAKPMIDQIRKAGDCKNDARRTDLENHWFSFAEALAGSLQWTLTSGIAGMPPPRKAIQEMAIDPAMFYVNKVRRNYKGQAAHDTWVKSLLQMLNALRDYAKEHHKAGLVWAFKAQGAKACSEYVGGAAPAAAAAPAAPAASSTKPAPAPASKAKSGAEDGAAKAAKARGALFAQLSKIDQSSGKTAGLRTVKKDANGKKFVEDDKASKMTAAKKARLAKMRGSGGAKKAAAKVTKPPVKELRGKKWAIENQPKGSVVQLNADECNIKQTVYIFNCEGSTIQVNGKVNTITVDKCTKTNVIFANVMGGCELVNCKSVKVQANGACPTVAVDKTDGVVIYAGEECYKTVTIVASKSSEMNLSWPGATPDDAWLEAPIPEQYQHKIVDGKVTCDVSDLYSH